MVPLAYSETDRNTNKCCVPLFFTTKVLSTHAHIKQSPGGCRRAAKTKPRGSKSSCCTVPSPWMSRSRRELSGRGGRVGRPQQLAARSNQESLARLASLLLCELPSYSFRSTAKLRRPEFGGPVTSPIPATGREYVPKASPSPGLQTALRERAFLSM